MKGASVLPRCPHCDGFLRVHCCNCSNSGKVTDWWASPVCLFYAFGEFLPPPPPVDKPCPICLGSPLLAERTYCHGCNRVGEVQKVVLVEKGAA